MRINSSNGLGWWATVLLYLVLSLNVIAKDKDPNMIVQGTVFLIDKDSSTIMVDTRTGVRRVVLYSPDTKFRYGRSDKGQESTIGEVQKTQYISCTWQVRRWSAPGSQGVRTPVAEIDGRARLAPQRLSSRSYGLRLDPAEFSTVLWKTLCKISLNLR